MKPTSIADLGPAAVRQVVEQIGRQEQAKRAKYGNKVCVVDGIRFASRREARRYVELKRLGVQGLQMQVPYALIVNGAKVGSYIADFRYRRSDGEWIVEDVKTPATSTPVYRLKKRLMLALYGVTILET